MWNRRKRPGVWGGDGSLKDENYSCNLLHSDLLWLLAQSRWTDWWSGTVSWALWSHRRLLHWPAGIGLCPTCTPSQAVWLPLSAITGHMVARARHRGIGLSGIESWALWNHRRLLQWPAGIGLCSTCPSSQAVWLSMSATTSHMAAHVRHHRPYGCPKLQAVVYDILHSTTAVFSYIISSRELSANEQFFVGAQTVVSLLQTTQIKQGVSFIAAGKVYTITNKTTIVWIETELFFSPGVAASHVYVRALALGCFNSHISTRTFRRAPTASLDSCAEIKSALQWRN